MGRNSGGGARRGGSPRRSGGRSRSISGPSRGSSRPSFGGFGGGGPRPHRAPPPPRPPRPPRAGGFFHRPPPPPGGFPPRQRFWGRPAYYGGGCSGCSGIGCSLVFLLVLVVIAVPLSISRCFMDGDSQGGHTQTAPPQTASASITSDGEYYTDCMGWIADPAALTAGMKEFYEETGVRPYLYLTDQIEGDYSPSEEEMDRFAQDLYEDLFDDENHFLFLFQEYGNTYMTWYVCGADTGSVLTDSALELFLDTVDEYYSSDLGDEEYFSTVFSQAGKQIAAQTAA